MADMETVRAVAKADAHAVVVTARPSGGMQASVVTAGVTDHPLTAEAVVAFVAIGGTAKLKFLRSSKQATIVFRSGGNWITVEGQADLIGPDDGVEGFDPNALPKLLRDVFMAAGGTHSDWAEYDRVMAEQRRTAVFIRPERIYGRG
ncbi:MAG: pyridoxamine 5'-phosphate oxidase [Chloroflexi bacterium]|nr:pyridoxamine 5'-phosphate oxidase [Chloroflexota bacterium]